MTLHPAIVADLLDSEIEVAQQRLGDRISGLTRSGTDVRCVLADTNVGRAVLLLDAAGYDAEPMKLTVLDGAGRVLPGAAWPGALYYTEHPILGRPFACVQGSYEYHCHPSHLADPWDAHRRRIRLAELLDHLVGKAGR